MKRKQKNGMGPRRFAELVAAAVALWAAGCQATPLPTPPSFNEAEVRLLAEGASDVELTGESGTFEPGDFDLRITNPAGGTVETPVMEDGSFSATLEGTRDDTYFLEAVTEEADLFVAAVTGASASEAGVATADPGPDVDGDGSPDAVDCAPDDDAFGGQRCP